MADINWKTVICMFIVILANMRGQTASGLLIVKPQDTYALAGQVATLNCSTSSTEDVHWYYGTSYVYAGRKLYAPYKDKLKIEVYQIDGTTAFNLVFPMAKPEDAGMYNCRDIQGRGETSSAEMTVFTTDGNGTCQSNMKPDGVVMPNDCNIDPDELQLSCSVTFYGKNPPQLEWKKVHENGNSVANTECQSINNRMMCNTSIFGDRQMNRSSYLCQTTGSSQLNVSLCIIEVKNLIYAFRGKTMTKSSVGNRVLCNLDTSESCRYKWKHSDVVVSTSRTMTPDRTGLYQCEAECNIRGKRCIVFNYAFISDDDSTESTSCSTGCVVGICVIILLLVIAILTVIYCFLLRKEKGKHRQLLNRPKSEENGTQQEQTCLVQLHKKMETIVDEPDLTRTLIPKAASKGKKAVFGVTILSEELFVLSYEWPDIEVFGDLQQLDSKREISLTDHQLEIPWDIQSSSKHKCLYIVDKKRNEEQSTEIVKIDPEGNVQKIWTTECIAGRLSVTNESNVIVTSLYESKIMEYSPEGDLKRVIELPSDAGIVNPWITLKRSKDEYVVSYGNQGDLQHGVCVINQKRDIEHCFGGRKGSNKDQLHVPVHMVAYSDGHILVADKDNRRVVLLSPELKFIAALFSQGRCLRFPNRMCLDERNTQLFVSDNRWISNMKPWNDGRVLVFDTSSVQASLNIAVGKK